MDIGERGYGGSEGQSSLSVVAADDQKLDAAAALTAFAQVGFQSTSNRTVEIPNSSSNSAAADPYYGNEGKNNDVMNGSNHGGGSGGGRYDHSGLSHDRPNAGASHEEHHRSVSATTGAYSRSTAAPLHSHENDPMVRNDDRGMPPYAASTYPEINDRHHDRDNDRATSSYHPTNAYYHHSSNNNNGENKKDESDHRNSLNSETSHSAALGYGSSVPPVDRNNIPHQQSHPNVFQAHSIFPHYAGKEPSQPSGLDISYKAEEELVKEGDADVETEEEADSDVDEEADEPLVQTVQQPVRGKPEAIARAHAAARVKADRASEREGSPSPTNEIRIQSQYDSAKETKSDTGKKRSSKKTASTKKTSSPEKKPPSNRKKSSQSSALVPKQTGSTIPREFLLGEVVPPITEAEYENLKNLMTQFCRVPLLSEFSRPVSILHPELAAVYSKIVSHPVDLGHVSRGIRRRQYRNCRDIRLDMWRVFANCVKYNSHPTNKDAVPSFVSIALHLREYFNNLWQEYMLPSDPPIKPATSDEADIMAAFEVRHAAFTKRDEERKRRLENSGVLVLSKTFTTKASTLLLEFIESGGRVDALDKNSLVGPESGVERREVDIVIQRLGQYHAQLEEIAESGSEDYTLDAFYTGLSNCYTEHIFEENPAMRNRFRCRLDRFFWKQAVPLHEANSRGVTQSSIWGNLAATIWARESSKKVFWPALCLGILPPSEQREGWHQAVTERNEGRLPEKLRGQLMVAKKRCEQAQKRQNLSYFLVEFLGTHEFIWVRETDIIENFDPNNDPNKTAQVGKKPRSSRNNATNVVGSKTYGTALQECVWANEEYENVLQDAFENSAADDSEEENEEVNYNFNVLAQSDGEADEKAKHSYQCDEDELDLSDVEEANYLISHDGILDTSAEGRKSAKKRSQILRKKVVAKKEVIVKKEESLKKKRASSKPKEKKDLQSTAAARVPKETIRAEKKELRELEKRRRKRARDHEKSQKSESRKKMKRRRSGPSEPEIGRTLNHNKRSRATAIVKAYLMRSTKEDESKSLALNGVMSIPAALVDSTGLLGMALAFRAATGEISMPDDGIEQLAKLKPWTGIDADHPKTSVERIHGLELQIALLEKEIDSVRTNAEKRRLLASGYVSKRTLAETTAESDDIAARYNRFKKKKKTMSFKGNERGDSTPPLSDTMTSEKCGSDEDDDLVSEKLFNGDDEAKQDDDHTDAGSDVYDSPEVSRNNITLFDEAAGIDELADPIQVETSQF